MPEGETLTKREEEVARAYAEGLIHKEIAGRLGVSPATVRTHLNSIYRKLDVRTKVDLVRRIGAIDVAPDRSRAQPRFRWFGTARLVAAALLSGLVLLTLLAMNRSDPALSASTAPLAPRQAGLPSVAVLPVLGLVGGASAAQSDFTAWLARQIVTGLSQFSTVRVFSADRAVVYAAEGLSPREIADRLGATYMVSVDAMWFGDVIQVGVQLQDAPTAEVLWATTIERREEELHVIQGEVVDEVVTLVGLADGPLGALRAAELARIEGTPAEGLDAYGHFLRGLVLFETYGAAETGQAIAAFDRAVAMDPGYGRAHAYAGWAHLQHFRNGWGDDPAGALGVAEARAERAIAVDPNDPHGHWTLGAVRLYQRRHAEALAAYERAITLNPQNAEMLVHYGWALTYAGRPDEGVASIERAMERNPRYPGWYLWDLSFAHFVAGRYQKAIEVLEEPRIPRTTGTHELLALSYAMLGEDVPATTARNAVLAAAPGTTVSQRREVEPFARPDDLAHYLAAMRLAGFPE